MRPESPLSERWGGWYVTGTSGKQTLYLHAEMRKAFNEDVGKELSETNQKILDGQATKIVRALFSADEFHMGNDGIEGSLEFQKAFTKGALKDDEHRSLRDLRLFERVFKYRCSYLIYSDVFSHLPDELKSRVLTQIHGVLTNAAAWPDFDYLTSSECHRILNILESTYPDWPFPKT